MAKYDYGGGCPCGLYPSCTGGCRAVKPTSAYYDAEQKLENVKKVSYNMNKEEMERMINWFRTAYISIQRSGGDPIGVIDSMDRDTLYTLVANDLQIKYRGTDG